MNEPRKIPDDLVRRIQQAADEFQKFDCFDIAHYVGCSAEDVFHVMHSTRYGAPERPQSDDRLTVGPYTATLLEKGSKEPKMVWTRHYPVLGKWTHRMLTEKELAAIKESWLRAHGVTPIVGAAGEVVPKADPQPATDQHTQPAARSRQEGGDHYKRMGVEPWDVIDTWPLEQRIGFFRGNALKYLMRMGSKDERVTEVRKARHYIDKLIETLEDGQE